MTIDSIHKKMTPLLSLVLSLFSILIILLLWGNIDIEKTFHIQSSIDLENGLEFLLSKDAWFTTDSVSLIYIYPTVIFNICKFLSWLFLLFSTLNLIISLLELRRKNTVLLNETEEKGD